MEYINIDNKENRGDVALSTQVLKDIAAIALARCEDAYPAKKESDSIVCKYVKDELSLALNLKLKYGCAVTDVCSKLQEKIHDDILQMTGIDDYKITLDIVGFVSEKN